MVAVDDFLNYSPELGTFTWKETLGSRASAGATAGCYRKDGYLMIRLADKLMYAHRIAIRLHTGSEPKGVVDHIDGDRSNNKISNLRVITQAGNCQNRQRSNKNSATGFRGVSLTRGGKFVAQVMVNRVHVFRKHFDNLEQAVAAVNHARSFSMEFSNVAEANT